MHGRLGPIVTQANSSVRSVRPYGEKCKSRKMEIDPICRTRLKHHLTIDFDYVPFLRKVELLVWAHECKVKVSPGPQRFLEGRRYNQKAHSCFSVHLSTSLVLVNYKHCLSVIVAAQRLTAASVADINK